MNKKEKRRIRVMAKKTDPLDKFREATIKSTVR